MNPCKVIPLMEEGVYFSKGAPSIRAGQARSRGKCSPCTRVAGEGRAAPDLTRPQAHISALSMFHPKKDHGRNFIPSPSRKPHAVVSLLVLMCGKEKEYD